MKEFIRKYYVYIIVITGIQSNPIIKDSHQLNPRVLLCIKERIQIIKGNVTNNVRNAPPASLQSKGVAT